MAYYLPRLIVSSSTTQVQAVANTPQVVTFANVLLSKKITVTSTSRFTIVEPGLYLIVATPQVDRNTGGGGILNLFVQKSGVDVPNSNSRWGKTNTGDDSTDTLVISVTCVAGDYLELWMVSTDTSMQISFVAAGAGAPATDSIIMQINKT